MSSRLFQLLFPLLALAVVGAAQEKPTTEADKIRAEKERAIKEAKGGGGEGAEGVKQGDQDFVDGKLVQREPMVHSGSRGFCRFDAAVQPKRLMPGQSGTVLVTIVLEGDAVLASASSMQVRPTGQGLTFGGWSLRPPTAATVAKAFLGQPVYDNWGVIEIPVTMPQSAPLGSRQVLPLDFEFDLVSGSTGVALGHFIERAVASCEVGVTTDPVVAAPAAVAQPPVVPRASEPTPSATKPDGGVPPGPAAAAAAIEGSAMVVEPPKASGSGAAESREPEAALDSPEVAAEGLPPMLLVGGGGVAVVLLLVIATAMRRKG